MEKIRIVYEGDLRTSAVHEESGARLKTCAPKDNYGDGGDFSPTDLVAVALATCIVTLMGIAAKKVQVDLKGLRAEVTKEMSSNHVRRIKKIVVDLYCLATPTPVQQEAIEQMGSNCPVHYSLHPDLEQVLRFHWGTP